MAKEWAGFMVSGMRRGERAVGGIGGIRDALGGHRRD
jgi:hypothetical protein